jgi:hypothetical protein
MSYSDLLKDPRWQRKRLEILNRSGFSCEECGDTTETLNVHHKRYRKGAKPWEYSDCELTALCEGCHEGRHSTEDKLESLAKSLTSDELCAVLEYAKSLIANRENAAAEAAARKAYDEANRKYVTEEVRERAKARRREIIKIGMSRPNTPDEIAEHAALSEEIANMVVPK